MWAVHRIAIVEIMYLLYSSCIQKIHKCNMSIMSITLNLSTVEYSLLSALIGNLRRA
jgi:hypothetical protein